MNYLSLIGLLIIFQQIAFAQVGYSIKPEEAQLIMKRKLLVITPESDPKQLEKLKKKGKDQEAAEIEKLYVAFVEELKEAIDKRWTIHTAVNYKTVDEFLQMDKSTHEEYIVMSFLTQSTDIRKKYLYLDPLDKVPGKKKQGINEFYDQFPLIAFVLAEDFILPVRKTVYSRKLPEACPGPLSLFFTLKLINNHVLESANREKKITKNDEKIAVISNHEALKEKILYIGEDWKEDNFGINQIKATYPYPVQIVDQNVLIDKIRSNESQIAVHFVWPEVYIHSSGMGSSMSSSTRYVHLIVDIQSGKILAASRESGERRLSEKLLKIMLD